MAKIVHKILGKDVDLKSFSKAFRMALTAVKNMKDIFSEPLPGRTPSKCFWEALASLKKGSVPSKKG